jgi:hypothetical protein
MAYAIIGGMFVTPTKSLTQKPTSTEEADISLTPGIAPPDRKPALRATKMNYLVGLRAVLRRSTRQRRGSAVSGRSTSNAVLPRSPAMNFVKTPHSKQVGEGFH